MNKLKSPLYCVGAVLLLIACVASFILSGTRLGVFDSIPGCGIGSGCDTVTSGPWGTVPGLMIPVSFIGVAWFFGLFFGWVAGGFSSHKFLLSVRLGVLASLGFIVVMISIGSFCKWCALAHACNILFWAICEFGSKKNNDQGQKDVAVLWISFIVALFLLFVAGLSASSAQKAVQEVMSKENIAKIVSGATSQSTLKLLEARHRIGSPDAPIQIVMFTDYQCPDCKRIETQLADIMKTRDDISVSVKHFPLCYDCNDNIGNFKLHGNACWAARAAEAASMIGGEEAWEKMHTWLFSQNGSFTDKNFAPQLVELGFDPNGIIDVMQGPETMRRVKSDSNDGYALGVYYTPMVFVNGVEYLWYYGDAGSLVSVIDGVAEKINRGEVTTVAPPSAADKLVEDWRVRRTRTLPGENDVSWLGGGSVDFLVWSDYQADITKEIDSEIKDLIKRNPDVRYAFRHYPIDESCNAGVSGASTKYEGSCYLAKLVEAVDVLSGDGPRWSMHDWIIAQPAPVDLTLALEQASLLSGVDKSVVLDVTLGIDVNGRMRADILSKNVVWRKNIPVLMIDGRFVPRWKNNEVSAAELFQRILSVVALESESGGDTSK